MLNILNTTVDVDKFKTVPIDLKKLSYAVDKKVVKNTKFNKLNTKVNNSEQKIPDATTLVHINQYNKFGEKIRDIDKKIPDVSGLITTTVLNTKIGEFEKKIPNMNGLVINRNFNTKIGEVESKMPDVSGLVKKTDYNTKISDTKILLLLIIINLQKKYLMQR